MSLALELFEEAGRTPKQRTFVLGVDLDGVVADFVGGLKPIAAEWLGVAVDDLPDDVSLGMPEWRLDSVSGYDALHRYAVVERDLFQTLQPFEGAAAVLRRLATRGICIRVITHRLFIDHFHEQAIRQTTRWLEAQGIPYRDLCFMKDKAAVCADLYLEDNPENIRALRAVGCDVAIMTNSANRHLNGPRAKNWTEMEHLIVMKVPGSATGVSSVVAR